MIGKVECYGILNEMELLDAIANFVIHKNKLPDGNYHIDVWYDIDEAKKKLEKVDFKIATK